MTQTERRLAEPFGLKIPLRVRITDSAAPLQRICLFARALQWTRCQKKSHFARMAAGHVVSPVRGRLGLVW